MDLLALVGWPVLDRIHIGPLAISPHGLGIAVGYLAGAWWMVREGRKRGLDEEKVGSILLWALIGAIVGARFFYVLGHLSEFESFTEMLAIWRGGISLVGGIFGAMIFAYPFMRRYGYRFLQVMDSAAIGLAFGIMVGRIGDLVIGDHLGKPTDFFLGWAYRGGTLPGPWMGNAESGEWVARLEEGYTETLSREGARLLQGDQLVSQGPGIHQTALYDLLIAGVLFLFLLWLNRRPRREGILILTFGIWYGAGRILTDFLRIDKTWLFGLTGSQWASVGVIAISLLVLLRFAMRPLPAEGVAEPEERPPEERPKKDRSTSFTPPSEPGARRKS
jgi:phosphatidylglycerol---prolipoprotein diacylglyceryl transferase